MNTNAIVKELKENNQDFEFYPTSEDMLRVIYPHLKNENVLDIGCGTCNFKKFMRKFSQEDAEFHNMLEEERFQAGEMSGEKYYKREKTASDFEKIHKYYVMEKSTILLGKLDDESICLGTDFINSTLIDKKVDTIFCNPPYSDFMNWSRKIVTEGNYKQAFLVIPQRWANDAEFLSLLTKYKTSFEVLGSFSFLDAERQARAKVDIVKLKKDKYRNDGSYYDRDKQEDFDNESFDIWFNDTFGIKSKDDEEDKYKSEYSKQSERKEKIKNQLTTAGEGKGKILVELYQKEYNTLIEHLKAVMMLDEDVMNTFGFSVSKIKEGLKAQIKGLKIIYWDMVFDEFDEIKERLTSSSRNDLRNNFVELNCVDFTIENIYALILWVIKNANKYYNSQLVEFYKKISDWENVKPYKSNQRLFERDEYRWSYGDGEEKTHYTLDYRIIMSSPFRVSWSGQLECDSYEGIKTLEDIFVISKNLGFEAGYMHTPSGFGEKTNIYLHSGDDKDGVFMEYKIYKNGNMHVKFNKEFTKAMNVEVSRLLGWIRTKEDIAKEFTPEMAEGAEKYFKTNQYIPLGEGNIKLLSVGV